MQPENRTCQNCKNPFIIETDDFVFYEKMRVPPPTFCPECRMIRRLMWRNNRSLYKRECALCKKSVISMYPDDGAPVMCTECHQGDAWDQYAYAQDIDWTKNFLTQVYAIFRKQPRVYQYRIGTVINSDYGNSIVNTKDAYLSYSILDSENIMYSESVDRSRDSIDSFISQDLDQCSWNIGGEKNYNSHFLVESQSCIDSYFLFDCVNCQNCCLSGNLRNQQYVFKNQKLSKDAYKEAIDNLRLDTRSGFAAAKGEFDSVMKGSIHKYAQILSSQNVTGDFISNSKNVVESFDVTRNSESITYSVRILASKDIKDCYAILTGELEYETMSGSGNAAQQIGSFFCLGSHNTEYSFFCKSSSNCFGCVGLKNAHYCILNKQYTKEEYEMLVPKLRQFMIDTPYVDAKGRVFAYGEFYPYEFSPFAYNETIVQDYFPITREEAQKNGYAWKEHEERNSSGAVSASELPDAIGDVPETITNQAILCAHRGACEYQCTEMFRIMPRELSFYKQKGLPLPELCPNCRHFERLKYRNTMHLYHGTCRCIQENHGHSNPPAGGCPNTFETTYAPDRTEKVYCEQCYQKEVL